MYNRTNFRRFYYQIRPRNLFPHCSIHPRDKETVGERLGMSGLAVAYGIPVKHTGPMPTKIITGKGKMAILYDDGKTAINVRDSWGFEVGFYVNKRYHFLSAAKQGRLYNW